MAKYCLGWYRLFDQSLIKIQHTAAELFAECYEATGYEVVPLILGMMYAHGIEVEPDLASARKKKGFQGDILDSLDQNGDTKVDSMTSFRNSGCRRDTSSGAKNVLIE